MASQQSNKDAAARESRANARESAAIVTSGARQKVDSALAGAAALGQQMMHPFDKNARAHAQEVADEKRKQAIEKRDGIRSVAEQQAVEERVATRGLAPEGAGREAGEDNPSPQPASQQEIDAPVEEMDRADPPTSEKQHTTLGEMLGREKPEDNPHIKHIEGNDVNNPHLDRNVEFREDEVAVDPAESNPSLEESRYISSSVEEKPTNSEAECDVNRSSGGGCDEEKHTNSKADCGHMNRSSEVGCDDLSVEEDSPNCEKDRSERDD